MYRLSSDFKNKSNLRFRETSYTNTIPDLYRQNAILRMGDQQECLEGAFFTGEQRQN